MILVLVSSALSVAYLWKIVEILWQRPEGDDVPLHGDENPALYLPLWISAIANLGLALRRHRRSMPQTGQRCIW